MAVLYPLPDDLIELIAGRFRTLSEPTRIKLLDRLREGEATVLELTELIGTTRQNLSKHLVCCSGPESSPGVGRETSLTTGSSTKMSSYSARRSAVASRNRSSRATGCSRRLPCDARVG